MASRARAPSEGPIRLAVALGSNLGDRRGSLRFGRAAIAEFLEDVRCSRIYETEPRHLRAQPRFLNACCVGRTVLGADEVLRRLKEIERAAGREAEEPRYGPRVLDLDLILYGEEVIDRPGIQVPHPRLAERAFVLVPLAEVAGSWVHPGLQTTVAELAERADREGVVARGSWEERA